MEPPYKSVEFKYGVLILRTKKFQFLMDRLGRYRITGPFAWLMLYIMPVAAGFALFLEFVNLSVIFSPQGAALVQYIRSLTPTVNLLIPGINPYVPIVYGWLALIVALVVHEGAHGVVARSLGMPVKSAGLLFLLILPIGAFVEVDDKVLKVARARDSTRVLAAGAGINFVLAILSVALLFNIVSTMTPASNGVGVLSVYQNSTSLYSPADVAGIKPGDFILSINNVRIDSALNDSSLYRPGNRVNLTITRGFIGIQPITPSTLRQLVGTYVGDFTKTARPYICIPTLPRCQDYVPFSDQYIGFYASPFGGALPLVLNLLFWMYFINFNLAIFNSLPIYPLDGGQAFDVTVKALGKGRLKETTLNRITTTISILLVSMIALLLLGPYLIF
ncbi:MAG: hypothetical protein E6K95_07620 [Thaumarchaeota archaeon]|nr:MAG: hypothetical protein E6K95_07620 [Nitrososphaerota archaeon]